MRKNLTSPWRALVFSLLCCSLPLSEAQALDTTPVVRPIEIGFDALIIRPLRLMNLLIGGAALGPSLLLSLPNGSSTRNEAIATYWTIPYEQLVERELGDL